MQTFAFDQPDSCLLPDLPASGRGIFASAIVLNNKIYKFGGRNSGNAANADRDSYVYDISSQTWTLLSPKRATFGTAIFEDGTYIYLVGGLLGGGSPATVSTAVKYDPTTDTFNSLTGISAGTSLRPFGKVALVPNNTGGSAKTYLACLDLNKALSLYDIVDGTWYGTPYTIDGFEDITSSNGTTGLGSCVINGEIHIFGNMTSAYLRGYAVIKSKTLPVTGGIAPLQMETRIGWDGSLAGQNTSFWGSVATDGTRMYVVRGSGIYLVDKGYVRQVGRTLVPRYAASCVIHNGYLYILGGSPTTETDPPSLNAAFERHKLSSFSNHVEQTAVALTPVDSVSDWTFAPQASLDISRWTVGASGNISGAAAANNISSPIVGNSLYVTVSSSNLTKGYSIAGLTGGSTVINHVYKTITVPAVTPGRRQILRFFVTQGSADTNDYVSARILSTAVVPVGGTYPASLLSFTLQASATTTAQYTRWGTGQFDLTSYSGQTLRLCFSWQNDRFSAPGNGGCTIDNIEWVEVGTS